MNKPINFETKIDKLNIYVGGMNYTIHIDTEEMNTIILMSVKPYYCFLTFPFYTQSDAGECVKVNFVKIGNGRKYSAIRSLLYPIHPKDIQTLQSFLQWLNGFLNDPQIQQRLNP